MDSTDPMNTNDDEEVEEAENDLLAQARAALSLGRFAEAKSYATRALESSNLQQQQQQQEQHVLANQILAIANVHLAAESRLDDDGSIAHDWYAVLQLGSYSHNICTPDSLSFAYFSLASLLNPETNRFANAAEALNLVKEAYNALSDHEKKSVYDAQVENARRSAPGPGPTFWSVCRTCFHVHQYERVQEGKEMRCVVCKKGFVAAELPEEPSVVEGTDMYFCTWGFFPLGFPGGYRFSEEKREKVVPEEKEMAATPVPQSVKRARQTARKTVRPVRFGMRLRSCNGEEVEDDDDGGVDGWREFVGRL